MENSKIINQDPPTEENTEEETEPTEEGGETNTEESVLSAESLQQDISHLKTEIKTLMNSMNYLIDIVKDNKKGSSRLIIKNTVPVKTKKDYLLDLFPATQEYKN